ncbi:unnamed protein product, partial [Adineta steineri]
IFVGCYLVEAVLQSDLRCFFDIGCLQQLIDSLSLVNISALDIILNSTASHYQEKSSLLEIVSNLMIEEWNNQTFYNNYFNICQPSVCTATYIGYGNIVYIITTIIGLIGGLTKVYRFIVPIFLRIIVRVIIPFIRKKRGMNNNGEILGNGCLGDDAKTYMLATISPLSIVIDETINTLRYARLVATITNVPQIKTPHLI